MPARTISATVSDRRGSSRRSLSAGEGRETHDDKLSPVDRERENLPEETPDNAPILDVCVTLREIGIDVVQNLGHVRRFARHDELRGDRLHASVRCCDTRQLPCQRSEDPWPLFQQARNAVQDPRDAAGEPLVLGAETQRIAKLLVVEKRRNRRRGDALAIPSERHAADHADHLLPDDDRGTR